MEQGALIRDVESLEDRARRRGAGPHLAPLRRLVEPESTPPGLLLGIAEQPLDLLRREPRGRAPIATRHEGLAAPRPAGDEPARLLAQHEQPLAATLVDEHRPRMATVTCLPDEIARVQREVGVRRARQTLRPAGFELGRARLACIPPQNAHSLSPHGLHSRRWISG